MKNKITSRQTMLLLLIFLISNALMQGYNPDAKDSSFLSVIIGGVFGIFNCFLYCRLIKLYPGTGLFNILKSLFGKAGALFVTAVYSLAALLLGGKYFFYMLSFVKTASLISGITFPFIILLCLCLFFFATTEISSLGRLIQMLSPIILVFLLLIFAVALTGDFQPLPNLINGNKDGIIKGAASYSLMPYGTFILLFPFFEKGEGIRRKTLIIPTALSAIILSAAFFLTLRLLGSPTLKIMKFPPYMALSAVNISRFFQRIEIAAFIVFVICHSVKLGVCGVFFVRAFNVHKRAHVNALSVIYTALSLILALTLFSDKGADLPTTPFILIISLVLWGIIPLFIYFFAEIKRTVIAKKNKM